MNIQEYISSGVIEQYMLGLTTPEETQEVEKMAASHPEVKEAIVSYQTTLESLHDLQKVTPPAGTKESILNAIRKEKNNKDEEPSIKELYSKNNAISLLSRWKWIAAASIILFLLSLAFNGIYVYKYQKTKDRYTNLLASQDQMIAKNNLMQVRMDNVEQDLGLLMNPAVKPIVMKGVASHPDMVATVYWDSQNRRAYLGNINLPKPPSGKEYQLWAIIDGKPVDMGMYPGANGKKLTPMKQAGSGSIQAFAVTLEKEGGSPTPTMDQMYVMGKI